MVGRCFSATDYRTTVQLINQVMLSKYIISPFISGKYLLQCPICHTHSQSAISRRSAKSKINPTENYSNASTAIIPGPESITADELEEAFGALETGPTDSGADGGEVLQGHVYDMNELEKVDKGLAPSGFQDDIQQLSTGSGAGSWSIEALLASRGVSDMQNSSYIVLSTEFRDKCNFPFAIVCQSAICRFARQIGKLALKSFCPRHYRRSGTTPMSTTISVKEVAEHNSRQSCWIIVHGNNHL